MADPIPDLMPKVDLLGRPQKDLTRLFHGIASANWLAERMPVRRVPEVAWIEDVDEEENRSAVVACPCEATVSARMLHRVVACECGRHYFFAGKDVWVFNSPYDSEKVSPPQDL